MSLVLIIFCYNYRLERTKKKKIDAVIFNQYFSIVTEIKKKKNQNKDIKKKKNFDLCTNYSLDWNKLQ